MVAGTRMTMVARRLQPREVVVRFVRSDAFLNPSLAPHARGLLGTAERLVLARLRPSTASREHAGGADRASCLVRLAAARAPPPGQDD